MNGSTYVNNLFRDHRRAGYTEEEANKAVFEHGFIFGSDRLPGAEETGALADAAYVEARRLGYSAPEARDEVFLTGYSLGKSLGLL